MKVLVINSSHVVENTDNSAYKFEFPKGAVTFKNQQLALIGASIYYSWPNITSSTTSGGFDNNSFSYTWIDGTVVTITMPDGFYDVDEINSYLQSQMVSNTHYLESSAGSYVYYLELITNSSYYAVQLNSYAVPTAAQAAALGYSLPAGATWALPAAATTPQLTVLSSNSFKEVIGFSAGTYPSVAQNTTYSLTSNNGVPQVTPVSSVIVTCSLVENNYSNPNNILYSFSPDVTYGSQISVQPPEFAWVDVTEGTHAYFTLSFLDQDFNRLYVKDNKLVVTLAIKEKEDGKN